MIYQGIDTAARLTMEQAKLLKENGISFVARYLVPNTGLLASKALTAQEVEYIRAAGLALMLCWETTAARVKGGAVAGAEDVVKARTLAENLGVPSGTVIYFATDYDAQDSDMPTIAAYYRAARIACGKYITGVYGGERVCKAMSDEGFTHLWQCMAWKMNGFIPEAHVIQYEWQKGANAVALAKITGIKAIDLDSASTLDGMWLPKPRNYEAEDAHTWCVRKGIVDDTMRDVGQFEVMLWRYHRTQSESDDSFGGLISN